MKALRSIYLLSGIGAVIFIATGCSGRAGDDRSPTVSEPVDTNPARKELPATAAQQLLFDSIQLHLVHHKPNDRWPVRMDYPLAGSVLPFRRVVAYYGNFYSAGMGILGELPENEMTERLLKETAEWTKADSLVPAIPAIHYIAVTAQRRPGPGGSYRARMPASQMEKALTIAEKIGGLLFLDIQVGHSDLETEIPVLEAFLKLPNVHLGIDPEYSMKGGQVPGTAIGTFDAADVNYTIDYLAGLVNKWKLPPKMLVVHRFTRQMVTNSQKIMTRPEVQVVMNMDGFGGPAKKTDSYRLVASEPVQFMGMKLFYRNDKAGGRLMKKDEVLALYPSPVYIQYQ